MSRTVKLNILYLSRWYPNRYDPMPGLFIQRHAEAAKLYNNIAVVYVHAVDVKPAKKFEIIKETINDVLTIKVYYRSVKTHIPILKQICKIFRYYRANFIGIKSLKPEFEKIDLVHVHILTRLGVIALFYKWFKKTNYIISEHWSRYLSATADFNGIIRKMLSRIVTKNASAVTTVTENLANAMKNHKLDNKNYIVLANVLSPTFLNYHAVSHDNKEIKNIVHVSCFEDKSKNVSGILRVVKSITKERNDVHFTLVGDGMDFFKMKEYASKLEISPDKLNFTGLLEGEELVKEMSTSSALLIFSNYENFPVVINESMSLGVPIISTNVGGISEYLNASNGILIKAGDEDELKKELNLFLDGKYVFNSEKIKQKAIHDFSMKNVGNQLNKIYLETLG
ncbi:MAG: hypothetical protein C0595_02070 [Marinilabiliales bacterium]|nr:MAG: hypothetical protein C0595_02070 [Marinilabiliales bacterium]